MSVLLQPNCTHPHTKNPFKERAGYRHSNNSSKKRGKELI